MIRNSILAASILAGLTLATSSFSLHAELRAEDVYSNASPSIVTLEVENVSGQHFVGSAFLALDEGRLVTAWHVVHDAKKVEARFSDNQRVAVSGLVAKSEALDLAVLEVPKLHRPRLALSGAAPRIGSRIYLVGSPRGLDFSISEGLVSQVRTLDGVRYYQLSCPISPGDSGGPVLNDHGEVIGVVSWRKADAENVGFAIPSPDLARMKTSLAALPWSKAVVATYSGGAAFENNPRVRAPVSDKGQFTNDFRAFQDFLGHRSGQHVVVTVEDGGKETRFSFEVPKEAAK